MYFPYLRGRQYELLALCELLDNKRLGKHIIPIIEPVKLSSTLIKTLNVFIQNNSQIAVIHNPQVGSFSKELKDEKKDSLWDKYQQILKNDLIIKAHIINASSRSELNQLEELGFDKKSILVISNNRDFVDLYVDEFFSAIPRYTLIPDESVYRRKIKK